MHLLQIIVGYSEEDEAFVAKLRGTSLAAHGDTYGEAVKELCLVISKMDTLEIGGIVTSQ